MISKDSTIGFIGLGAMGQLMARRLLSSGFKLVAYDHTSRKTALLATKGAVPAPSVRQLTRKAEVIISCLPNDQAVLSVYQGPEGVLACANVGSIVIEMSTISPDTSRALHRIGIERGIEVLDVAISGSTPCGRAGHFDAPRRRRRECLRLLPTNLFCHSETILPHGAERFRDRDEARGQRLARREYAGNRRGGRLRREGGPRSRSTAASTREDRRHRACTPGQAATRGARRLLAPIPAASS